jgi:hypothetical protein
MSMMVQNSSDPIRPSRIRASMAARVLLERVGAAISVWRCF